MMLSDAHTHPCDEGFGSRYRDLDELEVIIGCCSRTEDWDDMGSCADPRVVRSYGVHPWYADEWDDSVRDRLVDILSSDKDACVGEIGLDMKRGDIVAQEHVFREQLSIQYRKKQSFDIPHQEEGPIHNRLLQSQSWRQSIYKRPLW